MWKSLSIRLLFVIAPIISEAQDCRKTTVYFSSGKDRLKKDQVLILDSLLSSLHPDSTYLLELHGHTDDRGSEKDNLELSERRVKSVRTAIGTRNNIHVVQLPMYFGELSPASKERRLNRRVSLYVLPVNNDGTISIHGENGVQMRTPVNFFGGCGICLSKPSLGASRPHGDGGSVGGLYVNIETNCAWDVKCHSVEFRFPYDYFNEHSAIRIPKPVYVYGCGPIRSKDSVDVKSDERFKVRFDTLANEYIITHDCYHPETTICCGTRTIIPRYKVMLPASVERKNTYYYLDRSYRDSTGLLIPKDTLIKEYLDTFYIYGQNPDTLFGHGFYYGELLFMQIPFFDCPQKPVYTEEGFYQHTEVKVPLSAYQPLTFKDTIVVIKLPRKVTKHLPGYYIEGFDHFIPFDPEGRRTFSRHLLDYRFNYAVKEGSRVLVIPPEGMRIRHKKRKKLIKIRVKRVTVSIGNGSW